MRAASTASSRLAYSRTSRDACARRRAMDGAAEGHDRAAVPGGALDLMARPSPLAAAPGASRHKGNPGGQASFAVRTLPGRALATLTADRRREDGVQGASRVLRGPWRHPIGRLVAAILAAAFQPVRRHVQALVDPALQPPPP
jgi:hypothetical protein